MSNYGIHKLCRSALHNHAIGQALKDDPVKAMEQIPLTDEEKKLLLAGASGFLLSYLTRWQIFGLTVALYSERMRKAKDWRYPEGWQGVTSGRAANYQNF